MQWNAWADEKLAALMYPNITRTYAEAWQAFDYLDDVEEFGPVDKLLIRVVGAAAMRFAASKIKTKHGIEDERKALYAAAELWVGELGGRRFRGGDAFPDLSDLAVFGVFEAVRDCGSVHKDVFERHPELRRWFDDVAKLVPKD